jgi:general stress protein 26
MNTQQQPGAAQMRENFLELLKKFDAGTLVTRGRDGQLHGRPMSIARSEKDGALWFLTDADSEKVAELTLDSRALVSMADSGRFVVMEGTVAAVHDPEVARTVWREAFRVWFSGPDDPKLVVLRFEPTQGEYWNQAGAQAVKHAFQAAKAYVKGEQLQDPTDPDMHGVVKH